MKIDDQRVFECDWDTASRYDFNIYKCDEQEAIRCGYVEFPFS